MTCDLRDLFGPIVIEEPSWNGGARSVISFAGNCFFGFEVPLASVGVVTGLNTSNETPHYSEIQHGLYFSRGGVSIIESGIFVGIGPIAYAEGTRYYVVRMGSEVLYCQRPAGTDPTTYFLDPRYSGVQLPGAIIYVSEIESFGTVFLDASMYAVNDRIINETAGELWYVGVEDDSLFIRAGLSVLDLPFTLQAAEGGITSFAFCELPFDVDATGVSPSGVEAILPFDVLASDMPITSYIRGRLPFTAYADGSGSGMYTPLAGITGPLIFDVVAVGRELNSTIDAELPFAAIAFGSILGTPIEAGVAGGELPFTAFATGSNTTDPVITAGAYIQLGFTTFATGSDTTDPVITAGTFVKLPFTAYGTGEGDTDVIPTGVGYVELPFTAAANTYPNTLNKFWITLTFNASTMEMLDGVEITEDIYASGTINSVYVLKIQNFIRVASVIRPFYTIATDVTSTLTTDDTLRGTLVLKLTEAINASDVVTLVQLAELADSLVATGQVNSYYTAVASILNALTVTDNRITGGSLTGTILGPQAAYVRMVTDVSNVTDILAELRLQIALLTDAITADDTVQNVLTITVLETAEMTAEDSIELTAQYFASMIDRIEVLAFIKTPAELAQGWVLNTEANMPISEYDNYVFNSMAYGPDEMLGCSDQGLYVLDGENDAGVAIDAEITSLMLDFDTTKLKRMSTAYIGYTSNGQLLLKVRSVDQGEFIEHWFEGRNVSAQTPPGQNRVKIGKGLRSRYWTFELVNIDGSDFELDKVELYPIVLDRRI